MEQAQRNSVIIAGALLRKALAGAIAQVTKRYKQMKIRYGPGYTSAMVTATFLTLFLPLPGIWLVSVALIVVIAEIHRAIPGEVDSPRQSPPG